MELVREKSSEEDREGPASREQISQQSVESGIQLKKAFQEEGKSNNQGSQQRQKEEKLRTYHKILKYRGLWQPCQKLFHGLGPRENDKIGSGDNEDSQFFHLINK